MLYVEKSWKPNRKTLNSPLCMYYIVACCSLSGKKFKWNPLKNLCPPGLLWCHQRPKSTYFQFSSFQTYNMQKYNNTKQISLLLKSNATNRRVHTTRSHTKVPNEMRKYVFHFPFSWFGSSFPVISYCWKWKYKAFIEMASASSSSKMNLTLGHDLVSSLIQ